MTRKVYPLAVLAALVALAVCAAGDITLPAAPVAPVPPPPAPNPGAVPVLTGRQLYVIDAKCDAVVRVHPAGLVKVTKESGPLTIRGLFVDGTQVETRKYAGPFVFLLEAAGDGRAEIDVIPLGLKSADEIVTATVDVKAGQGPIPPPKPVDPVDPKPVPVTSFRVILVYESGDTLTAVQNSILYGKAVEEYLNATCTKDGTRPGWRRRDNSRATPDDTETMTALWAAVKPQVTTTPALAVEVNGKVEIVPFPASVDATVALLKTYAGGK